VPRILLAGAIMAVSIWGTEYLLPAGKTNILGFLVLTLVGGVVYGGGGILLGAFDFSELKTLLRRRRAKTA
jgi:hypothetical protein